MDGGVPAFAGFHRFPKLVHLNDELFIQDADTGDLRHHLKFVLARRRQLVGDVDGVRRALRRIGHLVILLAKSRLEVAKTLGINLEIGTQVSVQDGTDAGGRSLKRLWADETMCKDWPRAIRQYSKQWDGETEDFQRQANHDWTSHAAD